MDAYTTLRWKPKGLIASKELTMSNTSLKEPGLSPMPASDRPGGSERWLGSGLNKMDEHLKMVGSGLTLIQRVAICFAAGVIGGLAVVLFSHLLFALGLSATLGVSAPVSLKSPEIYRPLFWAGLWGIPFGLFIKPLWKRLYLFGLLYFLAPVLALFTIFLPMSGAGFFGLDHGGPLFTVYLLLVNLPFGIITAVIARAIIGKKP
jgi:hypothetical protein